MSSLNDRRAKELKYQLDALREPTDMAGRKWHLNPIMEKLYKEKIANDDNKRALKFNVDASNDVPKTINYCVEHNEYLVVEIVGVPASGKTNVGLKIATDLRVRWYKKLKEDCRKGLREDYYMPRVYIGSSVEDTQSFFKKAQKGDIIIQDEDPNASGSGADTLLKNIKNILSICREACINFIFISPTTASFLDKLVAFRLETMAKDYKRRVTKAALFTHGNEIALGYAYIHILDEDNKLVVRYLKIKRANIEKIKQSGGGFSATFKEKNILFYAEKIADYFVDRYGIEEASRLPLARLKDKCRWSIVGHNVKNQEAVAYFVSEILQERLLDIKKEGIMDKSITVSKQGINYVWENYRTEYDVGLLQSTYDLASKMKMNDGQKRGCEAFKHYYIDGNSQKETAKLIHKKMGGSKSSGMYFRVRRKGISAGYLQQFQESVLGTAGEIAVGNWYYPNYTYNGKQAEPDLVGDNHIVEVKTRSTDRSPEDMISEESYVRKLMKEKKPMDVVIFHYSEESAVIKFWRVVYI